MQPSFPIQFFFHEVKYSLRKRDKLKQFIIELFKKEKRRIDAVAYIFCSDRYLLNLNRTYLNHNYKTDILTFPIILVPRIQAEIYISLDRIKLNARHYKVSLQKELLRVMIHGALHLCGYQDKTASEQSQMQSKEDYYLKLFESFT